MHTHLHALARARTCTYALPQRPLLGHALRPLAARGVCSAGGGAGGLRPGAQVPRLCRVLRPASRRHSTRSNGPRRSIQVRPPATCVVCAARRAGRAGAEECGRHEGAAAGHELPRGFAFTALTSRLPPSLCLNAQVLKGGERRDACVRLVAPTRERPLPAASVSRPCPAKK